MGMMLIIVLKLQVCQQKMKELHTDVIRPVMLSLGWKSDVCKVEHTRTPHQKQITNVPIYLQFRVGLII